MFAGQISLSCFVSQTENSLLVVSDNLDPALSSSVAGVTAIDDVMLNSYPPVQPEVQLTHPLLHTILISA